MVNLFALELKNCIHRLEFKVVFLLLFLCSIFSFLLVCYEFYGVNLRFVRPFYEQTLIQSVYTQFILATVALFTPLLAGLIYSDSYHADKVTGRYNFILTRVSHKKWIAIKAIVIFAATFLVYFVNLVLNQFLAFIAFPMEGLDRNNGTPLYDIAIQNYNHEMMFDLLRIQSPVLYNLLFTFLISLFAALMALFIFSLFFVIHHSNRLVITGGSFIAFILLDLTMQLTGNQLYLYRSYIQPFETTSYQGIVLWFVLFPLVSLSILVYKGHRLESGLMR